MGGGQTQSAGRRDKARGQQSEPRPTESNDELGPNPGSPLGLHCSATFQGLPNGLESSEHTGQSLCIRAHLLP